MPGRYSHSVVLAGYSSQGIISLPNDKHIEYLRNSPFNGPPRTKSNSNIRPAGSSDPHQRSQSAMAVRSGRWTPVVDVKSSPTRRYFINGDTQQSARNVTSTRDSTPTYKPRKSIDTQSLDQDLPFVPRSQSALSHKTQPTPQLPVRSARRMVHRNISPVSQPEQTVHPSRASSEIRLRAANAAAALLQRASAGNASPSLRPRQMETERQSASANTTKTEHTRHGHLRPSNSNATMQTKIYDPIREQEEPDFDGFSDAAEPRKSYFGTQPTTTNRTAKPAAEHVAKEISRTTEASPSLNLMSRSRQSYNQSFQSTSVPNSEHERNFLNDDSESKLTSVSSASSLGSSNAQSSHRLSKPVEARKSIVQTPNAQWGLPEIEEHGVFEPELFAQDLDNDLDLSPSSPTFGESMFGMISSGRDVDFTADDDASSDAASACPPDIGRYRDEEETAPPQFLSRLKTEDVRAPSPGLQSNKSKKGFFSRLKAKSSWK